MAFYKIHSIKDSQKLSFIIEENSGESVLNQRLSGEGHIILSIEKVEKEFDDNLFCFEGRKQDQSFIEGKISAKDIFTAYDMLVREYKYSLEKLYPEKITDTEKREKIFQELQSTFAEKKSQEPIKKEETSKKNLVKWKKTLQSLVKILQNHPSTENENIITELKKLDLNNNLVQIQETVKEDIKKLALKKEDKDFYKEIKKIAKEAGVFIPPDLFFSGLKKVKNIGTTLSPLFEKKSEEVEQDNSLEKEYQEIHNNSHIHTLLKNRYRSTFSLFFGKKKKSYFYTLFREKKSLFLLRNSVKKIRKILSTGLLVTVFLFIITSISSYSSIFIHGGTLLMFLFFIFLALVIRPEKV